MIPTRQRLTDKEIYYRIRLVTDTCRFMGQDTLAQMLEDVTVSLRDRYLETNGHSIDEFSLAEPDSPPEEFL